MTSTDGGKATKEWKQSGVLSWEARIFFIALFRWGVHLELGRDPLRSRS